MGVNVYNNQPNCPSCGEEMDDKGDHTMNCRLGSERNCRHNKVCDTVHALASVAGISPRLEVLGLIPGLDRPADVLLPSWDKSGRDVAVYVTVTNPL